MDKDESVFAHTFSANTRKLHRNRSHERVSAKAFVAWKSEESFEGAT